MAKCEYCQRKFSTVSSLNNHKKTALYCVQARTDTKETKHVCEYCNKPFTTKYSLKTHLSTCPVKRTDELESYKQKFEDDHDKKLERIKLKYKSTVSDQKEINKKLEKRIQTLNDKVKKLEGKLQEKDGFIDGLKTAPEKKTIYNTAYVHPKLVNLPISNIPALTQEFVEQKVSEGILTYDKAARGYSGMLEIICELITHENDDGVVERNYVCTDVSRNSFHRLLESKKWKADKGGRYLNSMLDTFQEVMEEYKEKVYNMYSETPHDSPARRQVNRERKNISKLFSGVVCREGTEDREELVNSLRKDISKRAYV